MNTKVKEIFASIQGEGPVVGYKQLFIRFCDCNLRCRYCDTDFNINDSLEYSPAQLFEKITTDYDLETFHSISLTGGEPLLSVAFLQEFLPLVYEKTKIYLETNATLGENLEKIKGYIDIISADIKLESSTGLNTMELHKNFFDKCTNIDTFAKVVFDENITEKEIKDCTDLAQQFDVELILQPKMTSSGMSVSSNFCSSILDKFIMRYPKVRLIPQVHKFIGVQ